jgi:hypothetical protein
MRILSRSACTTCAASRWRRVMLAGSALALAALLAPAGTYAHAPEHQEYSMSIVEGETTQPEDTVAHVSAYANMHADVALSILRGGVTVYRSTGKEGAWLSQVPQLGDVVQLESPPGRLIASIVYDGLPSMDATVCAGSTNFSGQRSAGQTVAGAFFSVSPAPYFNKSGFGFAQVTLLSGSSFGGGFLVPLALGETVAASESLESPLPGGAVFTYESETVRPVGACPPPPPPPPAPPPPPPALQGAILKLAHTSIHALLRHGLTDVVGINVPGTVTQDLYLQNGTLPASAATRGRRHKPAALLLARGTATAKVPGKVTVVLHLTTRGRNRLRAAHRASVVLLTTLHSATGVKLNLARRSFTLHR